MQKRNDFDQGVRETAPSSLFNVLVTSSPGMDRLFGTDDTRDQTDQWTVTLRVPERLDPDELYDAIRRNAPQAGSSDVRVEGDILKLCISRDVRERLPELESGDPGDHPGRVVWEAVNDTIARYEQRHTISLPDSGRLDLTGRPAIMGVLNVTPDSFSDGGSYDSVEAAVRRAEELEEQGASVVDVGGESTRPGAEPVSVQEEIERTVPVIRAIADRLTVPVSIDTQKPGVANAAIEEGAEMINDVGGLQREPELLEVANRHDVPVVAMHMQGTPRTMQDEPSYREVIRDVSSFLRVSLQNATNAGLDRSDVVLDPGIGFGKTLEHNLELIRNAHRFRSLGGPVLLGTSRKSFIGEILDVPVNQRVEGTAASIAGPALTGVELFRVHDVRKMYRFLKVLWTIHRGNSWKERLIYGGSN